MDYGARRKPTSEFDFVRSCVAQVLGIDYNDDARLDPILSLRKMKVPTRFNSNLSAGCEELVTGLLGEDDLADVRTAVEEIATY